MRCRHAPATHISPLDADQATRLLEATLSNPWLDFIVALALTTRMRLGELIGLRWSDVDLAGGLIQVKRQIHRVPAHGLIELEPKSVSSSRVIKLTAMGAAALQRQSIRVKEMRLLAGPAWQEHDLVHPNSLGKPREPRSVEHRFVNALAELGLPRVRFHDLRHSAATLLLKGGIHPKVVQEILGHSHISVTMNLYTHYLPVLHEEAMTRLDTILGKPRVGARTT